MSEIVLFFKDIWNSSRERLKTPITSAYIFAFILFNWRPLILLLFSSNHIENTIELIDDEYSGYSSVLVPLVIALFYTIGIPFLMKEIDSRLLTVKKERKKIFYDLKKGELEMKGVVLGEERKNENIRSGNMQISELNDKIEEQSRIIESKEIRIKEMEQHIEILSSESEGDRPIDELVPIQWYEDDSKVPYRYDLNKKEKSDFKNLISNMPINVKKNILSLETHRAAVVDLDSFDDNSLAVMLANQLITRLHGKYYLTVKGIAFKIFLEFEIKKESSIEVL